MVVVKFDAFGYKAAIAEVPVPEKGWAVKIQIRSFSVSLQPPINASTLLKMAWKLTKSKVLNGSYLLKPYLFILSCRNQRTRFIIKHPQS
jgi:hypothetical protein